jgi:hypothetical protein
LGNQAFGLVYGHLYLLCFLTGLYKVEKVFVKLPYHKDDSSFLDELHVDKFGTFAEITQQAAFLSQDVQFDI